MHSNLQLQTYATPSLRVLRAVGTLGSILALTILGASILLRLTTVFGADGAALSQLSSEVENAIRLVHRLSASSVGILALVTAVLGWKNRAAVPHVVKPIVWIIAATVLLALIGPLTPGYRFSAVTIANVVAGTVLVAACWWLRETLAVAPSPVATRDSMLLLTMAVLATHVGLGAAASAHAVRGAHWVAFLHTGSAMLTTLLLASILWDRRSRPAMSARVRLMAALLGLQLVLGMVSLWLELRPVALGFVHAMVSALLAAGLVSVAVRDNLDCQNKD
ncbi:MAG: hypothetical protein Q7T69_14280 [Rhodoferax sp.]|nr:hypothetical protein [Rhodoferax sp.]